MKFTRTSQYCTLSLVALALAAAAGLLLARVAEAGNAPATDVSYNTSSLTAQQATTARDFSYSDTELHSPLGEPLTIAVINAGPAAHTFTINGLVDSGSIPGGQTRNVQLNPTQAGTFTFYCTIHGQNAMSGRLSLLPPATNAVQPGTQAAPPQSTVMQPPSTGDGGLAN